MPHMEGGRNRGTSPPSPWTSLGQYPSRSRMAVPRAVVSIMMSASMVLMLGGGGVLIMSASTMGSEPAELSPASVAERIELGLAAEESPTGPIGEDAADMTASTTGDPAAASGAAGVDDRDGAGGIPTADEDDDGPGAREDPYAARHKHDEARAERLIAADRIAAELASGLPDHIDLATLGDLTQSDPSSDEPPPADSSGGGSGASRTGRSLTRNTGLVPRGAARPDLTPPSDTVPDLPGATADDPRSRMVLVGTVDGSLHSIDVTTGEELWSVNGGPLLEAPPISAKPRDVMFIPDLRSGALYRTTRGSTEVQQLSKSIAQLVYEAPLVSDDNHVYVGEKRSKVYAIDAETGSLRGRFLTEADTMPPPNDGADAMSAIMIGRTEYTVVVRKAQSSEVALNITLAQCVPWFCGWLVARTSTPF